MLLNTTCVRATVCACLLSALSLRLSTAGRRSPAVAALHEHNPPAPVSHDAAVPGPSSRAHSSSKTPARLDQRGGSGAENEPPRKRQAVPRSAGRNVVYIDDDDD